MSDVPERVTILVVDPAVAEMEEEPARVYEDAAFAKAEAERLGARIIEAKYYPEEEANLGELASEATDA